MNEGLWLPLIDQQRCTGCGDCVTACPTRALALSDGKAVVAQPQACDYCAICEALCPVSAIELPYVIAFDAGSAPSSPSP